MRHTAAVLLTEYDHENANEAADCWSSHADKTGPSSTKRGTIHQIRSDHVRRDLDRSGNKHVEVDVAM